MIKAIYAFETDPAIFIAHVRQRQLKGDVSLRGVRHFTPDIRAAMAAVVAEICDAGFSVGGEITPQLARSFLEQFENMALRNRCAIKGEDSRRRILSILLSELRANHEALIEIGLTTPCSKLLRSTVRHGAIAVKLTAQFPYFTDMPSAIARALVGHPVDPRAFLKYARNEIREIAREPEFIDFKQTPSMIKHLVIFHTDARKALRKMQMTIRQIESDPEFADFATTPGLIKRVVFHHPDLPKIFLRKARETIASISADPEFADFAKTPGIIRRAVVYYPNTRDFLRTAHTLITKIANEEEFWNAACTPARIKDAALRYPKQPRQYLRNLRDSADCPKPQID